MRIRFGIPTLSSTILTLFVFMIISFPSSLLAQECVGDLNLTSQSEIDSFNCTTVTGHLRIEEAVSGNITNLGGLSELTYVGSGLDIINNRSLNNINGLSALTSVDTLDIDNNDSLTNIDGLKSLTSAFMINISYNDSLTNVDGLKSLTSVSMIYISYNDSLNNIDGLSALTKLAYGISLHSNDVLDNIDGLSSLTAVGRFIDIVGNSSLSNVDGLAQLSLVGETFSLIIGDNVSLIRCCSLYSLISDGIIFYINLYNNESGCNSVEEIINAGPCTGYFELRCSPHRAPFDGSDPLCYRGFFNKGVYPYLWPQGGIDSAQFTTQCDGFYHEQQENYVPWEPLGGKPINAMGNCAIDVTVYKSGGGTFDLATIFEITSEKNYELRCSQHQAPFDGRDPLCEGGNFNPGVYAYVWPQDGIKTVEQFITQCDGFYHNQTERHKPYEALGGDPIRATGSCEMSANVYKKEGGMVDLAANFEIDGGDQTSPYALRCSQSRAPFDGTDPICNGKSFGPGVYVYVWPENGINSVRDFTTQCNGFNHEQRENYAPWEALGGKPIKAQGDCTVNATVYKSGGGTVDLTTSFEID